MYDFAFGGIYDDAFSDTILTHLLASMSRVYGGFALAALFGIAARPDDRPHQARARSCSIPFLQLLRPIPVTAWLPLSMIFFGLGAELGLLPGLSRRVLSDPAQHHLRRALGRSRAVRGRRRCSAARGTRMFRKVVLPAALPSIFTGLRLGLGFAWIVIVVGEMTGVPTGLGAVIMDGRTLSRTELVICRHDRDRRRAASSPTASSSRSATALLRWSPQHHG